MKKCIWQVTLLFLTACNNMQTASTQQTGADSTAKGTFGYDLAFLRSHDDSLVVLSNADEASQVLVSPKYQAKVFTSTADGDSSKSFGWINYKAFTAPTDAHMNAYGGENRFWLGPEGGPFSLFFAQGKQMVFDHWKTPAPLDTEPWKVLEQQANSVHLQKQMKLVNYAGTELDLTADRQISILTKENIARDLGVVLDEEIQAVGYLAANGITNRGDFEWTEKTGMPCIWMLDMFNPSPETTILIPYQQTAAGAASKVATTDYFGPIPPERVRWSDGMLHFKADGRSRGKLGLAPGRARPVAGSWDEANGVLTLTRFDVDPAGRYLNQEWKTTRPPFSGDAVNAYNDGPLADGSQMGPFYEIESVSPAAFLKPGATLTHNHSVFHFTGNRTKLEEIAKKVLGVSLTPPALSGTSQHPHSPRR